MTYSAKKRLLVFGIMAVGGLAFVESHTHALKKSLSKYFHTYPKVYNPLDEITWTKVKNYGGVADIGSPHYIDVISHTDPNHSICPRSNGMIFSSGSIRIHETQHMLHCQIARSKGSDTEEREGLYYKNGKAIVLTKPKTKVTDFAYRIPQELREAPSPYNTYIEGQMIYPSLNNIGYLFNEWGAYISNITLNLELEIAGIPEVGYDSHAANYSPHFFGYLAIGMHHLRTSEPNALEDKQLKATFALYAESTWNLMYAALNSPVFGDENTIYGSHIKKIMEFYRNSPKFQEVRESLSAIYGEEWVNRLMY